jgi:hypothetical protein
MPPLPEDEDQPRRRPRLGFEDEAGERLGWDGDRIDRPGSRVRAADAVAGPAIALMVVGGLAVALALLGLAAHLAGVALLPLPAGREATDQMVEAVTGVVGAVLLLCWGGIVLSGAILMKGLKAYGYAMATSIIAMLPCGVCCLLGLPFGIWSLVVLSRPEVRNAFG